MAIHQTLVHSVWPSICSTYLKICSRQISSERAKKLLIVFAQPFQRAEYYQSYCCCCYGTLLSSLIHLNAQSA